MTVERIDEWAGSGDHTERNRGSVGTSDYRKSGSLCLGRRTLGNWPWVSVTIIASLVLRLTLLDFESNDYRAFLSNWYDFLVENGRWHGLGKEFSSYPPLYLYLLSLSTFFPLPKLYAIKLITIGWEYLAAWFMWKLVSHRIPKGNAGWLGLTLLLFLPTVVMNGALWGQCDIMYTTCFLASLLYLLERRHIAALVAFGLAGALKPQAIFWCPLLAVLFVSGGLPWRRIWVPAAVYVVSVIPQILAGRPIVRALGHWATVGNFPGLVFGAPNWYQWGFQGGDDLFYWTGALLTVWVTVLLVTWMRNSHEIENRLVSLALLSVLFPPFLLPGMHERYFFAADILSVVYAFYVRRGWRVAIFIQFGSAFAYLPYLFKLQPIPMWLLAFAPLTAMAFVLLDLLRPGIGQRTDPEVPIAGSEGREGTQGGEGVT